MRRLLAISAILSTAIGLVVAVMWVRGFFVADQWASYLYAPEARSLESHNIVAADGWLCSIRSTVIMPPGTTPKAAQLMDGSWVHQSWSPNAAASLISSRGNHSLFFWDSANTASAPSTPRSFLVTVHRTAGVRLWPVIVLCALLPALWILRFIRARRRAAMVGRCPGCGYDLRASPERCPECGRSCAEVRDQRSEVRSAERPQIRAD